MLRLPVNSKDLFYGVSLFILIGSVIFRVEELPLLNIPLAVVSMLLVAVVIVRNIRKLKFQLPFLLIETGIYLYIIFNTLRYHYVDSLFPQLMMLVKGLAVVAVFAAYNNSPKKVYRLLSDVFLAFIVLNLIQMTLFPDLLGSDGGMRIYLVSANYNQFGGIFMPGILASYIAASIERRSTWRFFAITFLALVSVAVAGSVTATVGFLLIAMFFFFRKNTMLTRTAVIGLAAFTVIFFYTFVMASAGSFLSDSAMVDKFMEYTGKSMTFSGRTEVWVKSLLMIADHPLLGIGAYASGSYADSFLGVANVHNGLLDLIVVGGVLLLCTVCTLVICMFVRLHRRLEKEYFYGELFIFIVFLFMMQLEVYNYFMLFLFFLSLHFSSKVPAFGKKRLKNKHEDIDSVEGVSVSQGPSVRKF
ncbi:MAG TPA: O-antigen ligase family protein [Candidatus Coprenecus pullistercoris]|nr:O-antigen ligase family protein [Candidatus Coprenecus pullistercoris]